MLSGLMIFVADGRFFPLKDGVKLAESYKISSKIQRENYKALKRLNSRQTDMEKKWLRERDIRRKEEMERMRDKIRRLQNRPRAQ
jgi:hypothetical protein